MKGPNKKLRVQDSFWDRFSNDLNLHGVRMEKRTIYGYTNDCSKHPPKQFKGFRVVLIYESNPMLNGGE